MTPIIAIVGRPNVGKSTLFNQLTKTRRALVADAPGLTRDRQYGHAFFENQKFIVIDTGGIGDVERPIDELIVKQSQQAIEEAHAVLFLVSVQEGLTAADELIAMELRKTNKPVFLVLNKADGINVDVASAEFHALGLAELMPVSALKGRGIKTLLTKVLPEASKISTSMDEQLDTEKITGIKIAIVGRPNSGKSTLVNRVLGEERVTVFDEPGTTRDSIFIPLERRGKHYTLIDTAGVRKRGKVYETVEKFSVIKTLEAIENCHVVVYLIDARENIREQDLKLLGFILEAGKALVIAVNKWDGLSNEQKKQTRSELDRRLVFLNFAKWHFISALHGTGVGDLFRSVEIAYQSAMKKLSTPELTKILEYAVHTHQPPLVKGRRIKLRYAHPGGNNPPIIVIHGNQVDKLPMAYQRYLKNVFRKKLHLIGTPIKIELCVTENPYQN